MVLVKVSKDDDPFYVAESVTPVRKDKFFKVPVNEDGFSESDDELISKLIDNKEGWVYMLTCLKGYLEFGVKNLRAALVK